MEWYSLVVNPNYEITKTGLIRNKKTHHILSQQERGGYLRVELSNNGKRKTYSVHRLVAEQFIPNTEGKKEVNHKDLNKRNNFVSNLEWVNRQENINHKMKMYGETLKQKLSENVTKYAVEKNKKPVCQYAINGNFIKEFSSMSEAERVTGINRKSIRFCIRGMRKSAGGYLWREGSTTIENYPERAQVE